SAFGLLHVGVDYRFSDRLVVGMLAQFDWMDQTDDTEHYAVSGSGWLAGPYVVARLHYNLLFDGRAAWGQSANEVSPFATYTDSFDTTRWMLKANFTGDFHEGAWTFAPHAGLIYFEEHQQAYVDSNNIYIPGQTATLGRLMFGPKIGYQFEARDGTR